MISLNQFDIIYYELARYDTINLNRYYPLLKPKNKNHKFKIINNTIKHLISVHLQDYKIPSMWKYKEVYV